MGTYSTGKRRIKCPKCGGNATIETIVGDYYEVQDVIHCKDCGFIQN